ncbi:MAG: hypothetical protein E4G97_01735, partial [Deltaproteobacteria bacterium]
MLEGPSMEYREDVIDLGEYWEALRPNLWKIALFSLVVGIIAFLLMFLMPNIYKSPAVIAPSEDEKKNLPAIGAIASTFGVQIGGPSTVEDLESLFRSNDLTVRVFRKHNIWHAVYPDTYDPKTGRMKVGWKARLLQKKGDYEDPSDWDAILAAEDCLNVSIKRKSETLTISFESPSPEASSKITSFYLEEAKNRLQEEALDRAIKNKIFIEEQIGKTLDTLTRDRLYTLYGQEVEREMMARNREQFGFRVIDGPRIPNRKFKP